MGTIFIFLATGFEEIEAVATIDVMRRGGLIVKSVSVTGQKLVEGAHGISVTADELFEDVDFLKAAMLVLPGGMPGASNLGNHAGLKNLLTGFHAENKPIAAICAAPGVLGGLGILDGKKVTCYPGFEDKLGKAVHTGKPLVVDGNVITGKGPGFAVTFGLGIVEYLKGKDAADEVAAGLLLK
ncbi:MAG: DJ-1/PfpI family protein [Candidatus Azobacteroides sp.]|nr:DJ-1/PfpI family protein [Candidatus Azobacteroides sp.]